MDAQLPPACRRLRRLLLVISIKSALLLCGSLLADAAVYRTPNFVVTAPTAEIARRAGKTAEAWRKKLAVEWLGKEMPDWYRPCRVRVDVGQIGAGGATTFSFDRGHVFGWNMRVQGTLQRILDSVIPHEVSHTVFASFFRRPLPRWADEGAATLVEHESEQRVQLLRLKQVLGTREQFPLRKLLMMKDYPRDMHQVLVLYAQGFSLADYLVQKAGRRTYLKFLDDAYRNGWDAALKRHYGFARVESLEKQWKSWFLAGSPRLENVKPGEMLASDKRAARPARSERRAVVIRSQSPETSVDDPSPASSPIAPDPRRGGRRHTTGSAASLQRLGATPGRKRALNEGWVPVIRRSRNPAAGTSSNTPSGPGDSEFQQRTSLRTNRNAQAPLAEQRRSPRDRAPDWSQFPHGRVAARP